MEDKAKLINDITRLRKVKEINDLIAKKLFIDKYISRGDAFDNKDVVRDIKLNEKEFNEVYLQTFNNDRRVQLLYGGSGSGKSEYIVRRYVIKFLLEKGHNGLFLRKFAVDCRRSIFELIKKVISEYFPNGFNQYVTINKSELSFNFSNGNKILLGGLDDSEKLKSITFENGILTDVWIEEATQCNGTEIREINRRLRGISNRKKEITISFNPIAKTNWVYTNYFTPARENIKFAEYEDLMILKTTIHDNKYATEEDIRILESETDVIDRDIYLNGSFGVVNSDDTIVSYSKALLSSDLDLDSEGEIYIGLDIAGLGNDSTVAKVRKGMVELDLGFELKQAEEEEVLQSLIQLINDLQDKYSTKDYNPTITVNIDVTGVGFGVGSQLRTRVNNNIIKNLKVNSINFGSNAKEKDRYFNLVTEMYFNIRTKLLHNSIKLLKDLDTLTELCERKYYIENLKSRRRIESKDNFKKRIHKSPDYSDALVLAFYVPKLEETVNAHIIEFDYSDDDIDVWE